MLLPLFVLRLLAAFGEVEAQLARNRNALTKTQSIEECINEMHVQNANLRKIVECLARSTSVTAFLEDTQWKLDLLEHRLDRLKTMQSPGVYVPSPYVHIDDVLQIEGSVAGFSCVAKLQVLQAIRRKLEHSHLMNGRPSTLFAWPLSRAPTSNMAQSTGSKIDGHSINEANASSHEVQELSCLLGRAIKKYAKRNLG
ncbi:uncharacterized protein LOC132791491 [Drosophila nasuta]|uniref:uncharacterized protein LOC132791491 n=1 Tax=Drosophila nasuta TaxID=42062 RepID=UPI00295E2DD2|nr:uncharacterized protein LOC132791491 [Drosophila nasuta]